MATNTGNPICELAECDEPGTKRCSRCRKVSYCSQKH